MAQWTQQTFWIGFSIQYTLLYFTILGIPSDSKVAKWEVSGFVELGKSVKHSMFIDYKLNSIVCHIDMLYLHLRARIAKIVCNFDV